MYIKPVIARDPNAPHRAATMLELFFDLVSVIAIAAAATGLHHMLAHNHVLEGSLKFATAFTGIWWSWVNFTWYASAFDNDDIAHRLGTMVIMTGALILASGVPQFFEHDKVGMAVSGFVIMRLGMVYLWLRVLNIEDAKWRGTALRYVTGLVGLQILWVATFLLLPTNVFFSVAIVLFIAELALPKYAESSQKTPWHKHHIVERHGLLNIIVLGESLLAVGMAMQAIHHEGHILWPMVGLAVAGMVIVCALWWLYYSEVHHVSLQSPRRGYIWGYGHIVLFSTGAAIGAGLAVMVEVVDHSAHISSSSGVSYVAVPAGLFLLGLWFIHGRYEHKGVQKTVLPIFAVLLFFTPFVPFGIYVTALLISTCLVVKLWLD